jgi:hypothetical protein
VSRADLTLSRSHLERRRRLICDRVVSRWCRWQQSILRQRLYTSWSRQRTVCSERPVCRVCIQRDCISLGQSKVVTQALPVESLDCHAKEKTVSLQGLRDTELIGHKGFALANQKSNDHLLVANLMGWPKDTLNKKEGGGRKLLGFNLQERRGSRQEFRLNRINDQNLTLDIFRS